MHMTRELHKYVHLHANALVFSMRFGLQVHYVSLPSNLWTRIRVWPLRLKLTDPIYEV